MKLIPVTGSVLLLLILITSPTYVEGGEIGGYSFTSAATYYFPISHLSFTFYAISLQGNPSLRHVLNISGHSADLSPVTFTDDNDGFSDLATLLITDHTSYHFKIWYTDVGGGGGELDSIRVNTTQILPNKDFTITSIIMDPSGMVLRRSNGSPLTYGTVVWKIYGDPGAPVTMTSSSSTNPSFSETSVDKVSASFSQSQSVQQNKENTSSSKTLSTNSQFTYLLLLAGIITVLFRKRITMKE